MAVAGPLLSGKTGCRSCFGLAGAALTLGGGRLPDEVNTALGQAGSGWAGGVGVFGNPAGRERGGRTGPRADARDRGVKVPYAWEEAPGQREPVGARLEGLVRRNEAMRRR